MNIKGLRLPPQPLLCFPGPYRDARNIPLVSYRRSASPFSWDRRRRPQSLRKIHDFRRQMHGAPGHGDGRGSQHLRRRREVLPWTHPRSGNESYPACFHEDRRQRLFFGMLKSGHVESCHRIVLHERASADGLRERGTAYHRSGPDRIPATRVLAPERPGRSGERQLG